MTLIFLFEIPVPTPNTFILHADSFSIVKKNDGKECLFHYNGNPFIVFYNKTQCSADLLYRPTTPREVIMVEERKKICQNHQDRTLNWIPTNCAEKIDRDNIVQTMHDDHFFYLYCYDHELEVDGENAIKCKNQVYKIPRTKSFRVYQYRREVNQIYFESIFEFPPELTATLNSRTFSKNGQPNFKELDHIIQIEQTLSHDILWQIVVSHNYTIFSAGGFLILLIMGILCVFWYRRRRRNLRDTRVNLDLSRRSLGMATRP